LMPVKDGKFPIPLVGASPISSPVLNQVNTAPVTLLANIIEGTCVPTQ